MIFQNRRDDTVRTSTHRTFGTHPLAGRLRSEVDAANVEDARAEVAADDAAVAMTRPAEVVALSLATDHHRTVTGPSPDRRRTADGPSMDHASMDRRRTKNGPSTDRQQTIDGPLTDHQQAINRLSTDHERTISRP